jgi:butyrate kinase
MRRTIKNGGLLFISFPHISALRHLKVKTIIHSMCSSQELKDHKNIFYQFAFNWRQVSQDLQCFGFELIEKKSFDAIKGLKDEVGFLTFFTTNL